MIKPVNRYTHYININIATIDSNYKSTSTLIKGGLDAKPL